MSKKLLVFGGSGHAKDAIQIARSTGYQDFTIVTSDGSCAVNGLTAIKESAFRPNDFNGWDCFVAIGNNNARKRFLEQYKSLHFISIISKSAEVSESATIGDGCYIGAHAYIGPDATVSTGCIVNTQGIIGHDSSIGAYSQIGPKVCVSGNVSIGENVFIGAGALFNNGSPQAPLTIPDDVHIGMGCHITASIKHKGIRIIPKPNYIAVK